MSFYDPVPIFLNVDLSDRMWSPDSRNTESGSTKHWGLDESSWIIGHFCAGGHSIPESVRKVIGVGIQTSSKAQNKGIYPLLDDFREIHEDSMLIHKGDMIAVILHGFVPPAEASEHVRTLGDLFRYGGTIVRSCSRESKMVLFGHMFCRGDLTVDRWVPFPPQKNFAFGCSAFSSGHQVFPSVGIGTVPKMPETERIGRKKTSNAARMFGRPNSCRRICVRTSLPGSGSWIAPSPRSCRLPPLGSGEALLPPWRSPRTTTPRLTPTGTSPTR